MNAKEKGYMDTYYADQKAKQAEEELDNIWFRAWYLEEKTTEKEFNKVRKALDDATKLLNDSDKN